MKKRFAALLLALVLMFSLASCGGTKPEDYVKSEIDLFITGEGLETVADSIGSDALQLLLDSLEYRILSSTRSGDTATVQVEITTLDMAGPITNWTLEMILLSPELAMQVQQQQMTEEEMTAQLVGLLYEHMTAPEVTTRTWTIDVNLTKGEEGWMFTPESLQELSDAMMGGSLAAMAEYFGGM